MRPSASIFFVIIAIALVLLSKASYAKEESKYHAKYEKAWSLAFSTCKMVHSPFFKKHMDEGAHWQGRSQALSDSIIVFATKSCGQEFLSRPNDADAIKKFTIERNIVATDSQNFWVNGNNIRDFLDGSYRGIRVAQKMFPDPVMNWNSCAKAIKSQIGAVKETNRKVFQDVASVKSTCPAIGKMWNSIIKPAPEIQVKGIAQPNKPLSSSKNSERKSSITGKIKKE